MCSTTKTPKKLKADVRWARPDELHEIMDIDYLAHDIPWTDEQWKWAMKNHHTVVMVAEVHRQVGGFMVYHIHDDHFELWSLTVRPELRRNGIGRQLVEKMRSKMRNQPERPLTQFPVSEGNTAGHLFLKACGFRAVGVLHEHLDHPWHGAEDAYDFHLYRETFAAEINR